MKSNVTMIKPIIMSSSVALRAYYHINDYNIVEQINSTILAREVRDQLFLTRFWINHMINCKEYLDN